MLLAIGLPSHLQCASGAIGQTEAGLGGRLGAPAERLTERGQHEAGRLRALAGVVGVEQLLDDDRLGLIDDHAPRGVTIGLEARNQLYFAGQNAWSAAQHTSSKTNVAMMEIERGPYRFVVALVSPVGDRCEVGRQILGLGRG